MAGVFLLIFLLNYYNGTCMKKISLLLLFSSLIAWGYTQNDINHANYLAQGNIIVDQSGDPAKYRLDDSILRQEIIGMMMKSHK